MQARTRFSPTTKANGLRSSRLRSVVLVAATMILAATGFTFTPLAKASSVGSPGKIVFDDSGQAKGGHL